MKIHITRFTYILLKNLKSAQSLSDLNAGIRGVKCCALDDVPFTTLVSREIAMDDEFMVKLKSV